MIYDIIISTYNIPTETYATNYDTVVEESLMKIIFSKFINDIQYNNDNGKYIDYILKNNYAYYYDMEEFGENTVYYQNDMQKVINEYPENNIKIVDFDMSKYASDKVKLFLFYLDIVYQLYDTVYNNNKMLKDEINIKCRYIPYQNSLNLYQTNPGYYNARLKITRKDNINNDISDIQLISSISNISLTKYFEIIKNDILKHIIYMEGNDIKSADIIYLQNIRDFYRLCRLKLMYLVAHSIYILTFKPDKLKVISVRDKISNYIRKSIIPVFINAKTNLMLVIQESSNKTTKYNDIVFDKSSKLSVINDKLIKNKSILLTNKKKSEYVDDKIKSQQKFDIISKVVFTFVILATIILIASELNPNAKKILFLVLTIIVAIMMIIVYYMSNKIYIEKFENIIKYPKEAVKSNNFNYNNIPVRITTSTIQMTAFFAFNNNDSDAWVSAVGTYSNGIANKTYKTGYAGEYLKIDLAEYIVLNNYTLKHNVIGNGSKTFRIYATKDNDAWNNINHSSWILLNEQTNVVYDSSLSKNFIISSNTTTYRYYMIIVNSLTGNGNQVNISSWDLYGQKVVKSVILKSNPINMPGTPGGWPSYPINPVSLPSDYNDSGLVNWDITVYGYKNLSVYGSYGEYTQFYLNIGNFRLIKAYNISHVSQSVKEEYKNLTTPLIKNKDRTITGSGGVYSEPRFTNCYYEINLRYYESIPEKEKIDLLLSNITDTLEAKKLVDSYYNSALERYNRLTNQVAELNKQYLATSTNITNTATNLQAAFEANKKKIELNLASSNLEYSRLEVIELQKKNELITLSNQFKNSFNLYTSTSNFIKDTTIKIEDLNKEKNSIISKFNNFLTISDKATDATAIQAMQSLVDTTKSQISSSTQKYITDMASIQAEQKKAEEAIARSEAELAYVTYEKLRSKALQEQQDAMNKATDFITFLNKKYNLNETNINSMVNTLQKQLSQAKGANDALQQEYNDLRQREKDAITLKSNIDTSVKYYNGLIADSDDLIKFYNAKLQESNRQVTSILAEKRRLEDELSKVKGWSTASIENAKDKYKRFELETKNKIQDLKTEKQKLIQEYTLQMIIKEQKAREELQALTDKNAITKDLENKIEANKILIDQTNYYDNLTKAYDISSIFKDMDTQILYNINDNINGLNYDIITPSLNKEYDKYNKNSILIESQKARSDNNINVKNIQLNDLKSQTDLLMNISFIISLSMMCYYGYNLRSSAVVAIIGGTIILTMYNVQLSRVVRTKHKHIYWKKPSNTNINKLAN